jgi:hypothetical protein
VLEGRGDAPAFRDSPALAVLADLVRVDTDASDEEARVFAAFAMTIALGWRLFGETALLAAGLDGSDADAHSERIVGYVRQLAQAAGARPS